MTIRLSVRHEMENKPHVLIFTEYPFEPDETEFFFAILLNEKNEEIDRFTSTTIEDLFKQIKECFGRSMKFVKEIIKPFSNPSVYNEEVEENISILFLP